MRTQCSDSGTDCVGRGNKRQVKVYKGGSFHFMFCEWVSDRVHRQTYLFQGEIIPEPITADDQNGRRGGSGHSSKRQA